MDPEQSAGSGVILIERIYRTNNRVSKGHADASRSAIGEFSAKVVGTDPKTDLPWSNRGEGSPCLKMG
jgi:S1-C subfamily serine protease